MSDRIVEMVLKFRTVLEKTEQLEPTEITAYQQQLLEPLLRHAQRNVPFYRERLTPILSTDGLDMSRWANVPILTRADALTNISALTAKVIPPHVGAVSMSETSGSTGIPLPHKKNELMDVASLGMTDRLYRWWKFNGNLALASFISPFKEFGPPPDGSRKVEWRPGYPRGLHHVIGMWADTKTQAEWLIKRRPHYLNAIASTLMPLAEYIECNGLDLRFDAIISRASVLDDETREACRRLLSDVIIDQYGAQEVGFVACECPHCGLYHISAESILVEVLDNAGRPCREGEMGRVVLTSLYNYAMPFIRYEIGDFAVVGPSKANCSIKLPTLEKIVGRYRNMFTLKDGRVIYPSLAIGRFRDFITFRQLQIIQTDYDQVEVHYVPASAAAVEDARGLENYIREAIDPSLSVRLRKVLDIPRSQSGKFEDFVSLVPRGTSAPSA